MENLTRAQQDQVRAALTAALQPLVKDDGVHLASVTSIATATRP
jgi:hypothetical protein